MKRFISLLSAVFFIIVLFSFTSCQKNNDKLTIGFFSNSKVIETNVQDLIEKIGAEKNIKITCIEISESENLETQIKKNKIDAIITPAGTTLNQTLENSDKNASVPFELTAEMFTTMRESTITKNNQAVALPLLLNHLEIDIDTQSFMDSEMKNINSWEDIDAYCDLQKLKVENPVTFAASNSIFVLDLLGALTESFSGIESYKNAVKILNDDKNVGQNFNAKELANKLATSNKAPLINATNYLRKLNQNEYLHQSYKDFTNYDVSVLAQDRRARVIFTTLADHRQYEPDGIARFSTIYMPSTIAGERHFTANVTYIVPVKNNQLLVTVLQDLLNSDYQSELSRRTGLAPVLANCRTPDKQASDVRYWVSATSTPLAGLGHETKLTSAQLEKLLAEILIEVENN